MVLAPGRRVKLVMLVLDSAGGACAAALFARGEQVAQRIEWLERGHAARLPAMVHKLVAGVGAIELIAATVGPGSFTGIRGCLALAHGLAAGWGCPVVGVGVAEALARGVVGGPVWVALHSRAGRCFLGRDGRIESFALAELPRPEAGTILTGNAAAAVAAVLAARGEKVRVHPSTAPALEHIAAVGLARHRGELPPCPAQPLYVDAPEARLPPA